MMCNCTSENLAPTSLNSGPASSRPAVADVAHDSVELGSTQVQIAHPPMRNFSAGNQSLPAAAADHGANRLVGTEILGAIDIEQGREFRPRAVDAALDGADRAAADRRGVFIGKAGGADQDQGFALVLRKFFQRRAKFLELEMRVLG